MSFTVRTRLDDRFTSVGPLRYDDFYLNGTPSVVGGTLAVQNSRTGSCDKITEHVFTDYKRRRSAGEVMIGNLDLIRESRSMNLGSLTKGPHPTWGKAYFYGDFAHVLEAGAPPLETGLHVADIVRMEQVALIAAYAKVNASDVLGGEITATLGQTIGMLKKPFASAHALMDKIQKTAARNRKKLNLRQQTSKMIFEATADAWHEHRYGWRPTVSDVLEIVHIAQQQRMGIYKRYSPRLVARTKQFGQYHRETAVSTSIAGGLTVTGTVTDDWKVYVSAGVIYEVDDNISETQLIAHKLGLSAASLGTTAWELTPYSFVVDAFVNVGDWLEAVTPNPAIIIKGNWVTTITDSHRIASGLIGSTVSNAPVTTYTGNAGDSEVTANYVIRRANVQLPTTPVLTKKPLSGLNQVTFAALTCSQLLSRMRG